MTNTMKIYFAGKIPKGDEVGQHSDWRHDISTALIKAGADIELLSPENAALDEADSLAVFGHDCHLIQEADLVVVNADQKLGVGTAQEMLIAKYFGKPVLTILPADTHHRRSNIQMNGRNVPDWKHPFVASTSDLIFDSVKELGAYLARSAYNQILPDIKTITIIDEAILHYHDHYPAVR